MRCFSLFLSVVLLALLFGCARSEGPADQPEGQEVVGVWQFSPAERAAPAQIDFRPDGEFTLVAAVGDPVEFHGQWTVDEEERLVLAYNDDAAACPAVPGLYLIDPGGDRLEFSVVSDECQERRAVVDGAAFTRVR